MRRHLLSAHKQRFLGGDTSTQVLSEHEAEESMARLRRQQRSGHNREEVAPRRKGRRARRRAAAKKRRCTEPVPVVTEPVPRKKLRVRFPITRPTDRVRVPSSPDSSTPTPDSSSSPSATPVQCASQVRVDTSDDVSTFTRPSIPDMSSAQNDLPDDLSVHTEDLDMSVFEAVSSCAVSPSESATSVGHEMPSVSALAGHESHSVTAALGGHGLPSVSALAGHEVRLASPYAALEVALDDPPVLLPYDTESSVAARTGPTDVARTGPTLVDASAGPDDDDEFFILPASSRPLPFVLYDFARFGRLSDALLDNFPYNSVDDFVATLRSRVPPGTDERELQCALNIMRGVEMGQNLQAQRMIQAITSAHLNGHQAFVLSMAEVCRDLRLVRRRPSELTVPVPSASTSAPPSSPVPGTSAESGEPLDGPASPDPESDND